jgi:4-diphosphocytidyl-2-C-methyl-D-erythritol kinase
VSAAAAPDRLTLPAPAKLNLFLHVIGRRADGYHLLQTVYQLLDWGDQIELEVRKDGLIERLSGPAGVPADQDLAVRAARLLQADSGTGQGATLAIAKTIPAGAGLGGGSSDAATVLLGLNRLWRLDYSLERLAQLGLRLGADVPVFVAGRSAFAEGIGERLQPLDLPERWFVVVWPDISSSTAEIFQAPELTRNTPALTMTALAGLETRNDLEPVAVRRWPPIAAARAWLSAHGAARMSGSGASVFVEAADEQAARAIVATSPWPAWAARGVVVSPLHRALGLA